MPAHVYYHHPDDPQYSIAYVTRDRDEISAADRDAMIEKFELEEVVYVLYTNRGSSGSINSIDDDFDDVLEDMSPRNRTITVRLLQIFEEIIEENEFEDQEKLEFYKQIELEKIPDAINRVDWDQAAVDVAAQLMSTLILKHPLPNANHRTSISLAQWYLESNETGFTFPEFATEDYEWKEWVNEFIVESKRILTVRQNTTAFSYLAEWGCDVVKRRNDIEITLAEYDLDLAQSDAFEYYGDLHTDLCTKFLMESVKRAGHDELITTTGLSKAEFVTYLEEED